MPYREDERKRSVALRDKLFRDSGGGIFSGKRRDFVLRDASLNLWAGIRDDAADYFRRNGIAWWMGENADSPTGHLLSSQVACLNHLYFLRQRPDVASRVLGGIIEDAQKACVLEDGYVEFEVNGKENYLNERSHSRGANSTSVDAAMVAERRDGTRILVLIEWKYTEAYGVRQKYKPDRCERYDSFLRDDDGPIRAENLEALYYEPFYQLMRQTFLGWRMARHNEYECGEFVHLHVIPEENRELTERVTSPGLSGSNISEAWKSVLREPWRYISVSPEKLLAPAWGCLDTLSVMNYLRERYWRNGDGGFV